MVISSTVGVYKWDEEQPVPQETCNLLLNGNWCNKANAVRPNGHECAPVLSLNNIILQDFIVWIFWLVVNLYFSTPQVINKNEADWKLVSYIKHFIYTSPAGWEQRETESLICGWHVYGHIEILILASTSCLNDNTRVPGYFNTLRFEQKIESWMKCMESQYWRINCGYCFSFFSVGFFSDLSSCW